MCGIVGCTGQGDAVPILLEKLRRLEYRGYDSAGIATLTPEGLEVRKALGRISNLSHALQDHPISGSTGIGHTRWATHGAVEERNAHPHTGGEGAIALVHNGVIENHLLLRRRLESQGISFSSSTDSEVIAQLIASFFEGDLLAAVQKAIPLLKGTYGLAVISPHCPGLIVGARCGSPLVIGLAENETFLASDPGALTGYADRVIYLDDHQLCKLESKQWEVIDRTNTPAVTQIHELSSSSEDQDLGSYPHYMLKEIYEQPQALENALVGRLDLEECSAHFGGLNLTTQQLRQVDRIVMAACGTSYHAALVGEYLFEEFARLPVEVEYASELRYRNPPLERGTVVLVLSQSGETADTLAALREARRKGHFTLGLCNTVGSTIARESDGGAYLHAGAEIGVASTKAFTNQLAVLNLLALYFGRMRHLSSEQGLRMIEELQSLPGILRETLRCHQQVKDIAEKYSDAENMLYLGRHYLFPAALEGALKLKEISYIHAEGYPAAEMKHGPIALVDDSTPSIFLMSRNGLRSKVLSNLEEIKARGGPVIAVTSDDDTETIERADDVILIPDVPHYLQPIVSTIPMQLFAYELALHRGCDVDKPRNLAKSVTVE